jgi:hypothetical protein
MIDIVNVRVLLISDDQTIYNSGVWGDLSKMAEEVKLSNGKTLYDIIWKPRKNAYGYARDISVLLQEGYDILKSDKPKYKAFNPENKQGTFAGLCSFISEYKTACLNNPDAKILVRVSND